MLKLKVAGAMGAVVPAGTLVYGLDADQIRRRREILAAVDGRPLGEVAQASRPLFFKAGEFVGFDAAGVNTLAGAAWLVNPTTTLAQARFAEKEAARAKAAAAAAKAGAKKKAEEEAGKRAAAGDAR